MPCHEVVEHNCSATHGPTWRQEPPGGTPQKGDLPPSQPPATLVFALCSCQQTDTLSVEPSLDSFFCPKKKIIKSLSCQQNGSTVQIVASSVDQNQQMVMFKTAETTGQDITTHTVTRIVDSRFILTRFVDSGSGKDKLC